MAIRAFHQPITKILHVSRQFPNFRIRHNGTIQPNDVPTHLDEVLPPFPLDVVLEFDAERTPIPKPLQTAVGFCRRKYKTSPLGERDDFLHHVVFWLVFGHSRRKYTDFPACWQLFRTQKPHTALWRNGYCSLTLDQRRTVFLTAFCSTAFISFSHH